MYRQIRGCVLNFLLENHFGSKAEMARQLDVSLRTVERLFENLDNHKPWNFDLRYSNIRPMPSTAL